MKKMLITVSIFIGIVGINAAFARGEAIHHADHHQKTSAMDTRISLQLSSKMQQHQLSNMRDHVKAIQNIVGLMAENRFEDASQIAHAKLGLNPKMQAMCAMFKNEEFKAIGMAFHKSGDILGDVLQTKDVSASLQALSKTMQYCVKCHAAYRQ